MVSLCSWRRVLVCLNDPNASAFTISVERGCKWLTFDPMCAPLSGHGEPTTNAKSFYDWLMSPDRNKCVELTTLTCLHMLTVLILCDLCIILYSTCAASVSCSTECITRCLGWVRASSTPRTISPSVELLMLGWKVGIWCSTYSMSITELMMLLDHLNRRAWCRAGSGAW